MTLMKIKRKDGKVAFVGLGGQGGAVAVDQIYNPASENAQSGKAVAQAVEEVKAFTDSMSIEGYRRSGVFVDITNQAEEVQNKYANGELRKEITFLDNEKLDYFVLPVQPGEIYKITTFHSLYISGYYFTNGADIVIEKCPHTDLGGVMKFVGEITVPDGATMLYVNQYYYPEDYMYNAVTIEKLTYDNLHFTMTDDFKNQIKSYVDQQLGEIDTVLDEIIALQDFYTGSTFDELHTYAQSVASGGAE